MRSLALGGLVAIGAAVGLSLGVAGLLALLCVAVATAFLAERLPPRLPPAMNGLARRHKLLTALYVVVALAAAVGFTIA